METIQLTYINAFPRHHSIHSISFVGHCQQLFQSDIVNNWSALFVCESFSSYANNSKKSFKNIRRRDLKTKQEGIVKHKQEDIKNISTELNFLNGENEIIEFSITFQVTSVSLVNSNRRKMEMQLKVFHCWMENNAKFNHLILSTTMQSF